MRLQLLMYFTLILSLSCVTHEEIEPAKAAAPMSKNLSDSGLPLAVYSERSTDENLDAVWNSVFGRMEVSSSQGFEFFISEDTLTCQSKMADLEMGIFEIVYIEKYDSLVFYKTQLPDGSRSYFHFFASFEVNGRNYIFENNPLVEFSEQSVKHMTEIVGDIQYAQGAVTENDSRR